MNANPAARKRSFLFVYQRRAKSSEAGILKQKKPRAGARGVSRLISHPARFLYGIFLFCLKVVDAETLRAAFFQNDLLCLYEMTALFSCCRLAGLNPFIKSVPYGRSILFV